MSRVLVACRSRTPFAWSSRPAPFASFARLARFAASALLAAAGLGDSACVSSVDPGEAAPRTCARDVDCGDHHYCSEAHVCRTDCYVDVDCYGPTKTAQCNAQGRCVETDLDAMPAGTLAPAPGGAEAGP